VVAIQVVVLGAVAVLLGWSPSPAGMAMAVVLLTLGTLSFGALGLLLGGALRAEAVLALANLVWFVLLLAGGIIWAPSSLPTGLAAVVELLPSGALAEGFKTALVDNKFDGGAVLVLVVWAAGAGVLASRTTKLT
jgi:ABC-2 type transport system permease protein